MKRIMYVECKSGELSGHGRIGWVELSRSTRSYTYDGKRFLKIKSGYKYNCIEEEIGTKYWISGAKKKGRDKLYGEIVDIDGNYILDKYTAKSSAAGSLTGTA